MKKRVICCLPNLNVGGIQRTFVDFANTLINYYNIDVFCYSLDNCYKDLLDKRISIIESNLYLHAFDSSLSKSKKIGLKYFLVRLLCSLITKAFGHNLGYKFIFSFYKKSFDKYDIAISYSQNGANRYTYCGIPFFVLKRIKAKKKIQFIHDDFKRKENRCKANIDIYKQYNLIVTLSKESKEFISNFLKESNIISVPNIILPQPIVDKSKCLHFAPPTNKRIIMTICRLADEKGLLRAINVLSTFEDNKKIMWYIIGTGPLENSIKEEIRKNHLDKIVIMLGEKVNPYPYLLKTDYYFMSSFNEAFPVVIDESHALNKPVLSLEYIAHKTQLIQTDLVFDNSEKGIERLFSYACTHTATANNGYDALTKRNEYSVTKLRTLFDDETTS